jgi:glycosyltransferase involved in cell wall biosynthesis
LLTIIVGINKALKSDVIYSNGNDFKSFIISFFSGRKCIHKIVGDTAWERAQNRGWFKDTLDNYQASRKQLLLHIFDWARSFPLKKAHLIITPSIYLKKIVSGWGIPNEKIKCVYNSFQPLPRQEHNFNLNLDPRLIYMCTICRLVPWKGVDKLIAALRHFPELGLIVVGDGPMESELKRMSSSLDLSERVFFVGRQPRENISWFLEKASFFILNSSYEGLPHVVLEAMSCKRIVVSTNVGGTPELVQDGETGIIMNYGDESSLIQAITKAIKENNSKIVENAYILIEKSFSFEVMLKETERILQSAIAET